MPSRWEAAGCSASKSFRTWRRGPGGSEFVLVQTDFLKVNVIAVAFHITRLSLIQGFVERVAGRPDHLACGPPPVLGVTVGKGQTRSLRMATRKQSLWP